MGDRKGESSRTSDGALDYARRVLSERKWFDYSLDTIVKKIVARERVDLHGLHHVVDQVTGEKLILPIRLRVSGIPGSPEGWDVAFFLANCRIDGFGYDERFYDIEGIERNGWHRHIWNDKTRTLGRASVALFDEGDILFRDFIMWALKEMKISYPKDDEYATSDMF